MAGSIGLAEYIQADFHQIVTAVLLAIALQIRFLARRSEEHTSELQSRE